MVGTSNQSVPEMAIDMCLGKFKLVGGLEPWIFLTFHFIYGMSSESHGRTPSFFRMVIAPPTSYNDLNVTSLKSW